MKYRQNSRTTKTRSLWLVAALAFSMGLPQAAMAASIIASNGKIKIPAKDSVEAPAYVTLENTTDQEITVIKLNSSAFDMAMISQSVKDNDQPREMLRPDLVLKPNSKLVMKKDGVHILFAGPKQKLKAGKKVTAVFYLNDSEKLSVDFTIVK